MFSVTMLLYLSLVIPYSLSSLSSLKAFKIDKHWSYDKFDCCNSGTGQLKYKLDFSDLSNKVQKALLFLDLVPKQCNSVLTCIIVIPCYTMEYEHDNHSRPCCTISTLVLQRYFYQRNTHTTKQEKNSYEQLFHR